MQKSGNQEIRKKSDDLEKMTVSEQIIRSAIAVHRELGPGFLESVYEAALCVELDHSGIHYERQKMVPMLYRGVPVGEHRLDLLVEKSFVVELKAAASLSPIHFATVRSYMKATDSENALIFNFAVMPLTIKRVKRVGREWNHHSAPPDLHPNS